jgi:hypothetical protein
MALSLRVRRLLRIGVASRIQVPPAAEADRGLQLASLNRVRKNAAMQSFRGADFVRELGIQEH